MVINSKPDVNPTLSVLLIVQKSHMAPAVFIKQKEMNESEILTQTVYCIRLYDHHLRELEKPSDL